MHIIKTYANRQFEEKDLVLNRAINEKFPIKKIEYARANANCSFKCEKYGEDRYLNRRLYISKIASQNKQMISKMLFRNCQSYKAANIYLSY